MLACLYALSIGQPSIREKPKNSTTPEILEPAVFKSAPVVVVAIDLPALAVVAILTVVSNATIPFAVTEGTYVPIEFVPIDAVPETVVNSLVLTPVIVFKPPEV